MPRCCGCTRGGNSPSFRRFAALKSLPCPSPRGAGDSVRPTQRGCARLSLRLTGANLVRQPRQHVLAPFAGAHPGGQVPGDQRRTAAEACHRRRGGRIGRGRGVRIDPKLKERGDLELLEDLIPSAVNQAVARARELHAESMKSLTEGFDMSGVSDLLSRFTGKGG
jgi:hypothetical protein